MCFSSVLVVLGCVLVVFWCGCAVFWCGCVVVALCQYHIFVAVESNLLVGCGVAL